jgi:hypothetical protein
MRLVEEIIAGGRGNARDDIPRLVEISFSIGRAIAVRNRMIADDARHVPR